jgi:putative Ca2+/H+ antiporter (TMEM165/GDT1 family)
MNFAIAIAVFPIIFLGELPDKTMFASLVMSTKGRPSAVWIGAAAAFVVHVTIAVTIGTAIFHLVPHRAVEAIVSVLFLIGAVLAIRESRHEEETEAAEEELVELELRTHRQTIVASFAVIFLAEWGDLTQILTANLAAHYHSPLSVGLGAVIALWAVAGVAVVGGSNLSRYLNPAKLRIVTAIVLFALAIVTAVFAIK